MAAPYLTPNQVFNITQGVYFTYPVSYSGVVNVWSAVGLPEGLDIDPDTGIVSGTPIGTTNRYGYITATNDDGKVATIIKFIITIPQTQTFEFNIAPTKGYADITEYQFTTNAAAALSAYSLLWNFGDGSISNILNPTHIYDLPGSYIVSLNAYTKTGVISLSSKIDVKLLINESIYFDHVPPPTFAGHYNRYPFTINFTSSFEGPHYIDLAAQFSRSYESQNPQNKWSFLRPEWRFLDLSGNRITTITTNNTLIYTDELGKINHDRNGFVIISNVGKRQNQSLTKLYGSANLPDAVEIFNFKTGGFRDLPIRLPEFISSGATSAQELEGIKTFTLLDRKEAVDFGLIEEETGVDYVPKYLRPKKGRY
jgi:PKD repeat protein